MHAEAHADNTSRIVWRFCCPAEYRNPVGHIFGGAIATLLDVGTSLCLSLVGKPKFYSTLGASRNLNITFLKPTKIDEPLRLDCKVSFFFFFFFLLFCSEIPTWEIVNAGY